MLSRPTCGVSPALATSNSGHFETTDVELARTTAAEDDKIDKLFNQTWVELIGTMVEDPTIISNASHLLFMLRYLERIGDHVDEGHEFCRKHAIHYRVNTNL